jgi:hypothetical protein
MVSDRAEPVILSLPKRQSQASIKADVVLAFADMTSAPPYRTLV